MKTHSSRADDGPVILVANACSTHDSYGHVIGVCFVAQDMTVHKLAMDKFTRVDGDNKAIIHNPNPLIPPIFGADQFGWCSEWNVAMTKLTGSTEMRCSIRCLLVKSLTVAMALVF